jgi:hypothetical protein
MNAKPDEQNQLRYDVFVDRTLENSVDGKDYLHKLAMNPLRRVQLSISF